MMKVKLVIVALVLAFLMVGCSGAPKTQGPAAKSTATDSGQAKKTGPQTPAEIAVYKGQDRQQILVEGAKQKGNKLVIYGTPSEEDWDLFYGKPFTEATGIQIEYWKGGNQDVTERILREAQAGRYAADVVMAGASYTEIMEREGLLTPGIWSPEMEFLLESALDKYGKQSSWVGFGLTVINAGYNTKMIAKEELPKTFEDLLDPKWKGKIVLESAQFDWFMTMAEDHFKGLDYMKKLSQQQLVIAEGKTNALGKVVSGEFPLIITASSTQILPAQAKGAPVDFLFLQPLTARPVSVAIPAKSNNPYGAALFVDFMISKKVQEAQGAKGRVPVRPDVAVNPPDLLKQKILATDIDKVIDDEAKWIKLFEDLYSGKL